MQKLPLLSILLIAFLGTYAQTKLKVKGFTMDGHIDSIEDGTLISLIDIHNQKILDSSFSVNGNFDLKGFVDEPTLCWLRCKDEYAIVAIENTDMIFNSPINNMRLNNKAMGGKEQTLLNQLEAAQKPYEIRSQKIYDSILKKAYQSDEERKALISKYNQLLTFSQGIYVDFGKTHPNSYNGLDILYRNRNQIDKDSLRTLYKMLVEPYKHSHLAEGINIFLEGNLIKIGKPFIDFSAKTIDGKDFNLSDLNGNYIYLTFWSAGCGPCRIENKELSNQLSELPKDLSIVSFSIDKHFEDWSAASKADKITWYNVSDSQGDLGKTHTLYDVQAIPHSYLINKDGIVIKQFVGYGADLINNIKEVVSKGETVSKTNQ